MNTQIQKAVDALNAAFAADPTAVSALLSMRAPCNQVLADHPTVQVGEEAGQFSVGFVGLLNGAIEPATGQRIAAVFEGKSLQGFTVYQTPSTQ